MYNSKMHDARLVSWPLRSGACNFHLNLITVEAKREVMDILKRCKKKCLFLLNHWSEDITRTSAFRWWCSRCQVAEKNPANLSDFWQIQSCGTAAHESGVCLSPRWKCCVWMWERKNEQYTHEYISVYERDWKRSVGTMKKYGNVNTAVNTYKNLIC